MSPLFFRACRFGKQTLKLKSQPDCACSRERIAYWRDADEDEIAIFSGRLSETASRLDAKAEQICQTYLDDAIKTLAVQGKPRALAISNARSACVQDVGLTGDEKVKSILKLCARPCNVKTDNVCSHL